jgi:alkylation response protein AidB-like acyl-CoA dehydrogenase
MIAKVEALQAWLEAVTYQMCNMTYNETSEHLAGQISFLKMQCTIAAGEIASDAMMVFGGRALTKTGMGRHIQHFHQTQVRIVFAFDVQYRRKRTSHVLICW